MSNRGYIYTVAALMFSLVLLAVISLYYESYQTTSEIDPVKIRTDELHYFVESCKKDLGRAMVISGRRAAVYMVDQVVNDSNYTGHPLPEPENGIKELLINGTLTVNGKTSNVTYMRNNTIKVWLSAFQNISEKLNFESRLDFVSIDIYHYDSFHFMEVITLSFNITDRKTVEGSMCSYENQRVKIYSLVPLDGVEDPLYPIKTANKVRRYITPGADFDIGYADVLSMAARNGKGTGGGAVLDLSDDPANTNQNIKDYNSSYPEFVPYTLFVLDYSYVSIDSIARDILKLSGGVINYKAGSMGSPGFPYVSEINPKINFTDIGYAAFKNKGNSHMVVKLRLTDYVQSRRYHSSADGPSFFDRLGLNQNLSEKYVNQSNEIRSFFGISPDPNNGLEGYVNVTEFAQYRLYDYGILPGFTNQSTVDYKYFNNTAGRWLCGTPSWLRLDAGHAVKYNLSAYVCDAALAGYWTMDEGTGTEVFDESRNGNTGTIAGGPEWTTGKIGAAIRLNGANYVTVADDDSLDASNDVTITMWIKPYPAPGPPHVSEIISKLSAGSGYAVEQDTGTGRYYLVWESPVGKLGGGITTSLQTDAWQHLAIVKSGLDVTIYVNGTIKTSNSAANETIKTNGAELAFGANADGTNPFMGEIDDVRIWKSAFTEQEVKDEFRSYQ